MFLNFSILYQNIFACLKLNRPRLVIVFCYNIVFFSDCHWLTTLCKAKVEQRLEIVELIKHTVLNSISEEREENYRCAVRHTKH